MRADFVRALEEVKPAFGVSSDELQSRVRGGIVPYGGKLPQLLESANGLIRQLKGSERTSLLSVLFEGPAGVGKTALAASIALQSEFPFVKLISPESFVGISEAGKAMAIARVFDDAHKSPLSLVVLDDLERLLEYVRIGPRFSNVVLQTLLVCIKKVPQKGKLVILATAASAAILQSVELLDAFNVTIDVPALGHAEAMATLQKLAIENAAEVQPAISAISGGIPIKKLLLVLEMSLKAPTLVDAARFTTTLQEAGLLSG